MPEVLLGNAAPIEAHKPDESSLETIRVPRPDLGYTETIWNVPDEWEFFKQVQTVVQDTRSHHSDKIIWVESNDKDLAQALARSFDCPIGRPDNWDEVKGTPSPYIAEAGDAVSVKVNEVEV